MRHISIGAILEWTKLIISLSSLVCLIWTSVRGWVHAWHFFCTKMSKAMPAWAPLWETSKIHSVRSWEAILTFNILTKYRTTFGCLCSRMFLMFKRKKTQPSIGFLRYGKSTSKIHICFMWLSLFILPMLRIIMPLNRRGILSTAVVGSLYYKRWHRKNEGFS